MTAPANDDFANATPVTLGDVYAVSVIGATVEATEFDQLGSGPAFRAGYPYTVWYQHTAASDFDFTITPSSLPDGYTDDGTIIIIVYEHLVGDPPATVGTVTGVTIGYPSSPITTSLVTGTTVYVQVMSAVEYMTGTSAPVEFDLTFEGAQPPPTADIEGLASITASMTQSVPLASSLAGHATVHTVLAVNSSYAVIHGAAHATAVMWLDVNPHVVPYANPYPPSAGSYPVYGPGRQAGLQLYEASGPTAVSQIIDQHVTIESTDRPTIQDAPLDWASNPLRVGVNNYSVERWIQLHFVAPFNSVEDLRMWLKTDPAMRTGWTLRFGTSSSYMTPVATASTIATTTLPTADPGPGVQNLLGVSYLDGASDGTSLWIVIQAELDPLTVTPGPAAVFSLETFDSVPLQLEMAWAET